MQIAGMIGAGIGAGVVLLIAVLWALDRLMPARTAAWGLALERRRAGLSLRETLLPHPRLGREAVPYLEGGPTRMAGSTAPAADGDAALPLVLLHGFSADKDNFLRVAGHLTPHTRVLIPDLAGFGDALRDPQASHTMVEQVARLLRWLDALGLQRVHLGGSSMGGFIAGQMAAMHPERVASLWLINAAGTVAASGSPLLQRYAATGEVPLLVRRPEDYRQLLAVAMHRAPFMPYGVRHVLAQRAAADYPLHQAIMRDLAENSPALDVQFRRIDTPTLITWGDADGILHNDAMAAQTALFHPATLDRLPGIGHLPMLECPARAAQGYLAFRRTVPRAGLADQALAA